MIKANANCETLVNPQRRGSLHDKVYANFLVGEIFLQHLDIDVEMLCLCIGAKVFELL